MSFYKYLTTFLMVVILAACGGGGGNPGTPSGGTATPPVVVVSVPTMNVSLFDSSGVAVSGISLAGGYVARATVKDANGGLVDGKLVTFSLNNSTIAGLSPTTALTKAGIAEVTIAPVSVSSVGAATLIATADVTGATITGQTDFAVQSSSLTLSAVTVGSASLPSGGNTSIQVSALIGNAPVTGFPVNVSFAASCGRINGQDTSAGGVSVTSNGAGVAAAVYEAVAEDGSLCSDSVTLTASSVGAASQNKVVTVAAPTAAAAVFVSAEPAQIFVAGSGALDQAIVKFKVLSSTGVALPNVDVKFSIVTNPGGIGLGSAGSTTPVTATTLASGEALISVFSGTIPGPVKIRAELVSNSAAFAESQNLTVASGPPSQRFMSLSVETFNIEGWNIDGSSTQLTVRLADRQGNAVEDGTVVNFTAEGGQVARSCATARVNGISQCSVSFISQNPRPVGGRVSVLAYTEGTKDYVDLNGNNKFDAGDTLINIGDAYRDDNENAVFESTNGEFVIPRSSTAACVGAGGPFPSRANTCNANLATTVRQQAVILFSSSNPVLVPTSLGAGGVSFVLRSVTNTLLPLPSGTTVTAQATDQDTTDGKACAIDQIFGSPVQNVQPGVNPNADLATSHSVTLKDCASGDSVAIKVKVPSGLETPFFISIP